MKLKEEIYKRLAWVLPKRLVYWCGMRLFAYATSQIYDLVLKLLVTVNQNFIGNK